MAPKLKLSDNFRVRTFGSLRNSHGLGKYLPAAMATKAISPFAFNVGDGVECINETRLSDSLVESIPHFPSLSEAIVVLVKLPDMTPEIVSDDKEEATPTARKRRKFNPSTVTRRWQEVWACKFAWAKGQFNVVGNLMGVVCKSCTSVSGRRKIMVPKGDNLEKHEGKRTCKANNYHFLNLKKGEIYIKRNCKHLQFTKLWAGRRLGGNVANQLYVGFDGEASRKGIQFSTLVLVLNSGRPMCDYERFQYFIRHLKVKNVPRKHWSKTSGWDMAEHLHGCVLSALKLVVENARLVSISVDKVTAVDNTSSVGVHVYIVDSWERIPHLLHLSCVADCGTTDHLTNVIMQALLGKGGLKREEIA